MLAAAMDHTQTCESLEKNQNCQCLTYGGYLEANVGVAGCVGWDEVSVGGQTCEPAPTFRLHTSTAHTS